MQLQGVFMLMLTETATQVIGALVERRPELPEGAGLRISTSSDDRAESGLMVSTSDTPQPGDQVVQDQQARVFLDMDAAEVLDDKVLDAEVDDTGQVRFLVAPQSPE
jgi:iron-sulfur cluster assembly protein